MAARISRTRIVPTASTSLLPFLYQTRTLTAPSRHPLRNSTLRAYSTSNSSSEIDGESSQGSNQSTAEVSNSTSETEPSSNDAPRPRKSYLQRRAGSFGQRPTIPKPEPQRSFKPPSMTRGEEQAFSELLDQLAASRKSAPLSASETGAETAPGKPIHEEDRIESEELSGILNAVLRNSRRKLSRARRLDYAEEKQQRWDIKKKLREFGHGKVDINELSQDSNIPTKKIIRSIVQRESAKIEAVLREAIEQEKGDTGIWDICKERIFSLPGYLGDRPTPQNFDLHDIANKMPSSQEPADTTKSEASTNEPEKKPTDVLEIPPSIPIEPVVTALYPKVLLVAFRLLVSHFPNSPLIGQFRSTIKSQGRTSAVLGTSTGLYNELIYFYWRVCNDLPGVVSLLQEMEVTGIEPDRRTIGSLDAILEQRERDLTEFRRKAWREKRGSAREPWWDMPPNRKAVRELLGPEGWLHRLEMRVQELENRRARRLAPIEKDI